MLLQKQLKLEEEAYDYSYDKFIKELSKRVQQGASDELAEGKLLIVTAVETVATKLKEYFNATLYGQRARARAVLEDYFDRPKDLALLILTVIINNVSSEGKVRVAALANKVNRALSDDYNMLKLREQHPKLYSYIEREFKKRGKAYIKSRKIKLSAMKVKLDDRVLSNHTLQIATGLLDVVINSGCNIIKKVVIHTGKTKLNTVIQYTDEAFKIVLESRSNALLNFRKYPIFIVEPVDWTGLKGSLGYYNNELYRGTMIKCGGKNKRLLTQYIEAKPLKRFTDVVNRIQKTSFRINKKLYNIIDTVLRDNIVDYGSQMNNPYLLGNLPFNRHQDKDDYVNVNDYGELIMEGKYQGLPKDKLMYKEWYKAGEIQKERILISVGKAIILNLAMNDAKAYLEAPNIYFSYQSDFRGRLYPVQQHLNPQSKGEIKALLEFSTGYPIENDYQLDWFKIHGANCYGKDKMEYEDRIAFIDTIEEEIIQVADDPIRNQALWKDTDEPYLYLAWCFEYSDYLKDNINFRSHIPIALDATCSGIQIYSGLLLDKEGAAEVNVTGNTERKDIYQKVADLVNSYLDKGDYSDTINFKKSDGTVNTCSTMAEASSMKGKVNRKLTKSNVMTQPYSVTTYGMYQQILEVLNAMEDSDNVIWKGDKWVLARLLTQLNDRAIVETVKGARIGQEFLKKVTKDVVAKGNYIFYTTPIMEFPVLQNIQVSKSEQIRTELGRISIRTPTDDIHKAKMVSGIAPNFIHSLDVTLLALTVEKMSECKDFHLIHDSFGVPITHVESLNTCVREAYIELFEAKPLHKFVNQVDKDIISEVDDIMMNTLDLNEVRESRYIFS